jgi:hypothetical protein
MRFGICTFIALITLALAGCGTHSNSGPGPTLADKYDGVYTATQPASSVAPAQTVTITDFGDGTLNVALPGGDTVHITGVSHGPGATSAFGSVVYLNVDIRGVGYGFTLIVDLTTYSLRLPAI